MIPIIDHALTAVRRGLRSPRSRSALGMTASIAVAAAVWVSTVGWTTANPASVVALSVSPSDVTTGGISVGTVSVGLTKTNLTVQLASRDARIAAVPSSVTIRRGSDRESFSVKTTNGVSGCTELSATEGGVTKRASIFVLPHPTPSNSPVALRVPATAVGGQTVSSVVDVIGVPAGTHTVQLASSDPTVATVPATVTVSAVNTEAVVIGKATFPITTRVVTAVKCSVITATLGGTASRMLIKLFPISG